MSGNTAVLAGATPGGLPWPASTDPANQGANAIKALAEALEPRVKYQYVVISGGYTTAAGGGIAFTVPFANVVGAVAILVGSGAIAMQRASGSPAYQVWINPFNTTNGQLVTSTFLALDLCVWGY